MSDNTQFPAAPSPPGKSGKPGAHTAGSSASSPAPLSSAATASGRPLPPTDMLGFLTYHQGWMERMMDRFDRGDGQPSQRPSGSERPLAGEGQSGGAPPPPDAQLPSEGRGRAEDSVPPPGIPGNGMADGHAPLHAIPDPSLLARLSTGQWGMIAHIVAHRSNIAAHKAGLELEPVPNVHGRVPPPQLPALTSLAAVQLLSDADAHAWFEFYCNARSGPRPRHFLERAICESIGIDSTSIIDMLGRSPADLYRALAPFAQAPEMQPDPAPSFPAYNPASYNPVPPLPQYELPVTQPTPWPNPSNDLTPADPSSMLAPGPAHPAWSANPAPAAPPTTLYDWLPTPPNDRSYEDVSASLPHSLEGTPDEATEYFSNAGFT